VSGPDVVVVGAGAGGGVAAWALAERGVQVLLLETGPRFDPSQYQTYAQSWEVRQHPFEIVSDDPGRKSYTAPLGEPLDPAFAHLASRSPSVAVRRAPEGRRRAFYWARALGVGGSTLHYHAEAHRFPAHAFRMRTERGVAEDWPIGYEDLAPYYERVERLLGVAGDPDNPFKPKRGPYPLPAHPLSSLSLRVSAGAQQLGWRNLANPLAVLSRPAPQRAACHYCNGCSRGCMVGAKGSVDVAVIPRAEASGRLRLRTDFHVSRLEHGPDGRVTGVLGHDGEGREQRIRARAVVLAAGAVETPRILLNSAGGAHPHGVGNANDQVGRNLMEFLYVLRYAVFDEPLEPWAGLPTDSHVWDWNGAKQREHAGGIVLGQGGGIMAGPVGTALEAVSGFGIEHRKALTSRFGRVAVLHAVAEQLPRPENRVTLSAEESDLHDVPLAHVATRLDAADLALLSAAWKRLGELSQASGVREEPGQITAYDLPNATHLGGTCRMGRDPERSVIDALGAVHGRPELVVADASALATQGAGDSPSLTIQALALRAAEALAERARRGEI
jgi:choline dehydrogenase-like flavoprotein